jgi:hypothetical protein
MVNATPSTPQKVEFSRSRGIKPATPDIIQFNDDIIPVDQMADLTFESIGGQEILSIARHDLVNGQKVLYSPIKNLTSLGIAYNPKNIFSVPDTSQAFFGNFSIKLDAYLPEFGTGPNQETVYIDRDTGSLVVNVINLTTNEAVDIQILTDGDEFGDIMFNEQ